LQSPRIIVPDWSLSIVPKTGIFGDLPELKEQRGYRALALSSKN